MSVPHPVASQVTDHRHQVHSHFRRRSASSIFRLRRVVAATAISNGPKAQSMRERRGTHRLKLGISVRLPLFALPANCAQWRANNLKAHVAAADLSSFRILSLKICASPQLAIPRATNRYQPSILPFPILGLREIHVLGFTSASPVLRNHFSG